MKKGLLAKQAKKTFFSSLPQSYSFVEEQEPRLSSLCELW